MRSIDDKFMRILEQLFQSGIIVPSGLSSQNASAETPTARRSPTSHRMETQMLFNGKRPESKNILSPPFIILAEEWCTNTMCCSQQTNFIIDTSIFFTYGCIHLKTTITNDLRRFVCPDIDVDALCISSNTRNVTFLYFSQFRLPTIYAVTQYKNKIKNKRNEYKASQNRYSAIAR